MPFDYPGAVGRDLWKATKGRGILDSARAASHAYEAMCIMRMAVPECRRTNCDNRSTQRQFIDTVKAAWPIMSEDDAISLVRSFFAPSSWPNWKAVTRKQFAAGVRDFIPPPPP